MSDNQNDRDTVDFADLESAEDFLDYFGIAYDAAVVQVNRLHILQRFHDYLAQVETMPQSAPARFALHQDLLQGAYQDFVQSNARAEKVFKVFKQQQPVTVGLNTLLGQLPDAPAV